jgi:hypothetical protein
VNTRADCRAFATPCHLLPVRRRSACSPWRCALTPPRRTQRADVDGRNRADPRHC